MLQRLREQVLDANLELVRRGLVLYTFGNVSGISREEGLVVIKPSGVPYAQMKPEHLVITDLSGDIVEGKLRPSSDLPTHLVLYNQFAEIGGVAHSHSAYATAWAQARKPIPCFGTTHADYFHGPVPVTAELTAEEIAGDYEKNTGHAIVRGGKTREPLLTTLLSLRRLRAWPTLRWASMRRRSRRETRCATSIILESTARVPIMGRRRTSDSSTRRARND